MGRAYRVRILPGFLLGIVLSLGIWLTLENLSSARVAWIAAAAIFGSTLWLGPAFSELYARVFVPHYRERSFPTFAGTLTFWVGIVFSLIAIVFEVPHHKLIVVLNLIAAFLLGYLIPLAYDRGWAGGGVDAA